MNDRIRIETLLAELDADVAGLDELVETNARAAGRVRSGAGDDLDWAALGYTIHNIYNALESYFLRVSKFFRERPPGSNMAPGAGGSHDVWRSTECGPVSWIEPWRARSMNCARSVTCSGTSTAAGSIR